MMKQFLKGSFSSNQKILILGTKLSKKHGFVKKFGFLVPVNGAPIIRQVRQYSALKGLRHAKVPLLRLQPSVSSIQERGVAMFVLRAVRGVLKLRYLVLGGAIGGGMSLQRTYDEWMDNLKELDYLKKYLPNREQFDEARNAFLSIRENVKIDQRYIDLFEGRLRTLKERVSDRWEQALQAAEEAKNDNQGFRQLLGNYMPDIKPTVVMNAVPYAAAQERKDTHQERLQNLQNELMAVQLKYQKELEKLEKENKELRKQLLLRGKVVTTKKLKKSLIDMYSEVLDELSDYDSSYRAVDHLPRVVVVGDQSSGKTSVLEMIVQARIFPRGAGEMMTRAPVMVTLSEGPYHVAQFKDSAREFDLSKEADLADLRREVEIRMKNSVAGGKTVSDSVISMTVQGPGLQRIVLVDLPGIISSETADMASNTRESIKYITQTYMSNPNAIILCIQDGSVDAERSNVTDLVAQMDPSGKRTIFVLTKVDMAEENMVDRTRIKKILTGSLFKMKALGYFAVVTGRGRQDDSIQTIKDYEQSFFSKSKLFREIPSTQYTTRNLSMAVSECFWKMVRETVEQQADTFKATRFNLETEWKNSFPKMRMLDRDELFEKARGEILDGVATLSQVSARQWDELLLEKLWTNGSAHFFENIYLPATQHGGASSKTFVDIQLKRWVDTQLPFKSIECGREALKQEFQDFVSKTENQKDRDTIFDQLKESVVEAVMKEHTWEEKGAEMLRALQLNALDDEISEKSQWDTAIKFMETCLNKKLEEINNTYREMFGPGMRERWTHWRYLTYDQQKRGSVRKELEKILHSDLKHGSQLSSDELTAIKKNMQAIEVEVDSEYIRSTWSSVYRRHFLTQAIARMYDCRKNFYIYQQGHTTEVDCNDVVLFWRTQQVLKVTANALRQQVMNREARRLEKEVRDILEDYSQDTNKKKALLTAKRVMLAEEIKKVREVQEKLEEFIQALNKEK